MLQTNPLQTVSTAAHEGDDRVETAVEAVDTWLQSLCVIMAPKRPAQRSSAIQHWHVESGILNNVPGPIFGKGYEMSRRRHMVTWLEKGPEHEERPVPD